MLPILTHIVSRLADGTNGASGSGSVDLTVSPRAREYYERLSQLDDCFSTDNAGNETYRGKVVREIRRQFNIIK